MRVNRRLLPIKLHYFFFMAASGPILPYLTVYGKNLGISEVVMGSITGVLPIVFLLAKPFFGFLADYFMHQRKLIFILLILCMSLFYVSLHFIPPVHYRGQQTIFLDSPLPECNISRSDATHLDCQATCHEGMPCHFSALLSIDKTVCVPEESVKCNLTFDCTTGCSFSDDLLTFYSSFAFYGFVIFMSLSMTAFNVANSVSDAICFDILGDDANNSYGKVRVWGAAGFGMTALVGGFVMDFYSKEGVKNYTPAFILVLIFTLIDLLCCTKLRLPKMMSSENILKDVGKLIRRKRIVIFLVFTTLAGLLDSFIIYFLFWFLEDLAAETNHVGNINLLEGLTVAAETLGSEILFFPLSGWILDKIGYNHALTICFFNYALRLGLISMIPSPWWVLSIELFMQGPTYALTYSVIVAYANAVSPPGTSATMQGVVAGMDDGLGYAAGSLIGGFLYKSTGGRRAFLYYSLLSLGCCIAHFIIHALFFSVDNMKDLYTSDITQQMKGSDDEEMSKL